GLRTHGPRGAWREVGADRRGARTARRSRTPVKAAAGAAGARRALCLLLCLAALACSQGCGEVQSEPVRVVASSFGGYSLAKAVAGEHAVVNLMSTQDDDPHGYRPDAFSIANLACADLLV